ncbi:amino acid permease [Natrinema salifodinae]|uniref:Amino acid/polyamine/organocation transporter, APC superfamily n=1 Tax=Natrinema salifodinae TaxID=1202768 RepID=A0A1I0PDQ3_9EURY|nr:amino acid permease [Natrinema salifodinae]SEW12413.1 amino acid/polyamine/organocation transporter, APC superfamily [Natrinema salifodinae]
MSADEELAKDLGLLSAITIGIGTMIGAGIFVLPGTAVARTGPLAAATFVIGGVTALFTALSASELGTAMPKSGGAYFYVNRALGPLFGSISGWANWMGLAFASSFYMYGFGEYVNQLVGAPALALGPITVSAAQTIGLVGATLFIAVNYVGAKETGGLQIAIVLTLLAILAVFTVVGLLNGDLESLRPLAPPGTTDQVLPVTAIVFVSYLGFVQITSVAEEIKDPGRNLPLAVIGSVLIVTTVYALFLLVLLAAVPTDLVADNETAVVEAAQLLFGRYDIGGIGLGTFGWAMLLFGGLLATASSANASILSSSRINFAMGREKIISPSVNDIHQRFGTPYKSILITGVLIIVFLLIGDLELLSTAGSVLHLIVYGLLNVALIVMREADPADYDPDFEVPLYPFVPIVGTVSSFALIAYIEPRVIGLSAVLVVFAAVWYLLYARQRVENAGVFADWILDRSAELPDAAVAAADSVSPEATETAASRANDDFRVMVPLANPRTERELITLAGAIATQRGGTVHAVHIVQVPDQTPLERGAEHAERMDAESQKLLDQARADAETFDVPVEAHTVLSHRSFAEIFDAARTFEADQVVMGWGPAAHGRAEPRLDELTQDLPCDFLLLKDRDFDPERILLPTAGGPDSVFGAEVVRLLREEFDARATLLHAVDGDESREEGERFLEEWAAENGLSDADLIVDERDVETAIGDAATDATLLVIGATERGLLSRFVQGSLVLDVLDDVECSVLLAETARERTMRERLLGIERE